MTGLHRETQMSKLGPTIWYFVVSSQSVNVLYLGFFSKSTKNIHSELNSVLNG